MQSDRNRKKVLALRREQIRLLLEPYLARRQEAGGRNNQFDIDTSETLTRFPARISVMPDVKP